MKSRNGIAIVFSFFGDNEQVGDLMQKASNTTRSYYFNALGFNAFLKPSILKALWSATAKESMDFGEVTKY